jgi:hypothetical protein
VIVVIVVLVIGASSAMPVPDGAGLATNDDQASSSDVKGTPEKLVFAHYFPPYPISLDNVDPPTDYYAAGYLDPNGSGGEYAQYGSMLRDRPIPRPPRPEPDWRELDLATEIGQASAAGIDGFTVDILTTAESTDWVASVPSLLLRAAEIAGKQFRIMLMPDMHGELGTLTPEQLADEIARLATSPAAFRLDDGRLVVSPYKAENRPPPWWREFLTDMKARHGIDVALLPVFVDDTVATVNAFSPITFGMSAWGGRNPAFNPVRGFPLEAIKRIHRLKKLWMQPVSMQDYRPTHQVYDEAENTTNFRNTWLIAIKGGADWVQIATWNDYSENTSIAPSVRHGNALLDLTAYYAAYFKNGVPPAITHDRVFLSHRTQLIDSGPYPLQSAVATLRQGSSPGRDAAEALSFFTAPATVTVSVGSVNTVCEAPAGVSTCVAPLGKLAQGSVKVRAQVHRDKVAVIDLTSPFPVATNPSVQDLSYVFSEGRSTGD